ncbi:hypothetical protein D3C71_1414130 [compost metagenome]
MRIDVETRHRFCVGAQQQADAKHPQSPNIADKCGAEGRHRDFKHRPGDTHRHAHHQQPGLFAPSIAGLDGFRRRNARRPGVGGRKDFGVKHAIQQVGVKQHCHGHTAKHRQDQLRLPHHIRHGNGHQQ